MPKVTYIQPDGTPKSVEAPVGTTLMEAAVDNDVQGIVAECGGACSCATCHVYVNPEWLSKLMPPDAEEWKDVKEKLKLRQSSGACLRRVS